ncbi:hypothetical protein V5P93_000354 [Actinokineospora auranticolor]|uniref:Uncharacterized protein n=1 Tax=Actinokineospora auranticolor TaxID=155976 RepID=A0A2S6GKJ4_9PSEU|nr:hypothetical protein [Actinokineospora auranticolor]PPK65757.1 hypothetical protein CLV40_11216 [Actinokineospora auranticolor]
MASQIELPDGGCYGVRMRVPVGERVYAFDRPLIPVSQVAAVAPDITVTDRAIEIRTDRWGVIEVRDPHIGEQARVLPVVCGDPDLAARVASAFTADSAIGWDSDAVEREAWCLCWMSTYHHDRNGGAA